MIDRPELEPSVLDDDGDDFENWPYDADDDDGHDPWQWADGVWCCEVHELSPPWR